MVLRKISIDNSVKYVPITEKDIRQNRTKNKKNSTYFTKRQTKQKIFKK